jgi:hypothetical protein
VLRLLKRKPKLPAAIEQQAVEPAKRDRQQNIKVSLDCSAAFAALAEAQGMTKAAFFEDMVAERLEAAQRQGLALKVSNR